VILRDNSRMHVPYTARFPQSSGFVFTTTQQLEHTVSGAVLALRGNPAVACGAGLAGAQLGAKPLLDAAAAFTAARRAASTATAEGDGGGKPAAGAKKPAAAARAAAGGGAGGGARGAAVAAAAGAGGGGGGGKEEAAWGAELASQLEAARAWEVTPLPALLTTTILSVMGLLTSTAPVDYRAEAAEKEAAKEPPPDAAGGGGMFGAAPPFFHAAGAGGFGFGAAQPAGGGFGFAFGAPGRNAGDGEDFEGSEDGED